MDSNIPSYLKSLESVLGGSVSTMTTSGQSTPQLPSFLTSPSLAKGLTTSNGGSTDGKLKLLLVGTHAHNFTGYSKITYGLVRILAKLPYLALTHFGFQKHPNSPPTYRPYPPNVRVLDAAAMEQQSLPPGTPPQQGFGFHVLSNVIRQEQPHVVMIYNDMAVVSRFCEEIRKSGIPREFKLWIYVDQVYPTQPQAYLDILNRDGDRIFTFTEYWKKVLKAQGITRPIDVLGHGFEREIFYPMTRSEVRKKVGLPDDAFVLLSLNRNQPRKRYDLLLMAFVELIVKYPTKPIFLMCICDKGEKGGWLLFEIFARELKMRGVPIERFGNRLMVSNQDMVYRDEDINVFYNVADVGVSAADGEGWGLCHFEQMGVGIPQVVPNVGGFKEYCSGDNSILVTPKHRGYLPMGFSPVGGEVEVCDAHDICVAVEEYLLDSMKRKLHGELARKKVLEYTWENVTGALVKRLKQEHEDMDS